MIPRSKLVNGHLVLDCSLDALFSKCGKGLHMTRNIEASKPATAIIQAHVGYSETDKEGREPQPKPLRKPLGGRSSGDKYIIAPIRVS